MTQEKMFPDEEKVEEEPLDITEIQSWSDAREVAVKEFDKLRNSSADEVKNNVLKAGNRIWQGWKRFREG